MVRRAGSLGLFCFVRSKPANRGQGKGLPGEKWPGHGLRRGGRIAGDCMAVAVAGIGGPWWPWQGQAIRWRGVMLPGDKTERFVILHCIPVQ